MNRRALLVGSTTSWPGPDVACDDGPKRPLTVQAQAGSGKTNDLRSKVPLCRSGLAMGLSLLAASKKGKWHHNSITRPAALAAREPGIQATISFAWPSWS